MIRSEHKSSLVSRLASFVSFVSLALLFAGCATKYGAFEPKPELEKPNPEAYAGYGNAMAHRDGCQMAYEWQQANPKLVADATVRQLVMCPKCPKAPACRKVWVAALKRARANTDDGYVRTFCDQQLRICE